MACKKCEDFMEQRDKHIARKVRAMQKERVIEARFRRKYPCRWNQQDYERELERYLAE